MSGIRTFVAVRLSEKVRAQVQDLLSTLQPIEPNLKWVPPDQWHFTLAFLGNVLETQLSEIQAVCHSVGHGHMVFALQLGCLGVFPNSRQPRIVWLGVQQGSDEMQDLHKKLQTKLQALGCALENRAFVSHLSLGRARKGKYIRHWSVLEKKELTGFKVMSVESIELMRSDLDAKGPHYSVLGSSPLLVPGDSGSLFL
jgi:RNA 2',3'-cyclic 3'-phosphodiesterase